MVAILGMLLTQIGSPVFNGTNCTQKLKSHLSVVSEVFIHVLLSLSSVVFAVVVLFSADHVCSDTSCDQKQFFINGVFVAIIIMSFVVLLILCTAIFLLYLYLKYFRRARITNKLKWPVFKFSVVLTLLVTDLTLQIFLYWMEEETYIFVGGFTIIIDLLAFVFFVTVMAMLYIPRSKCCKEVPDKTPLLANSHIQCTNPSSVWDHRNTPSDTVFNPPPEMSDCVD